MLLSKMAALKSNVFITKTQQSPWFEEPEKGCFYRLFTWEFT